jgi:alpha-tubulin suppressor-like RCC1 family protein
MEATTPEASSDGASSGDVSNDGPLPEAEAGPPNAFQAIQVSAGEHHTCAVTAGHLVYCWGSNMNGELGVSPTATPSSAKPVQVPMVSNVLRVSAGYTHTCAVDANGVVTCWGANDSGQLGRGVTSAMPGAPSPITVHNSAGALTGVLQVSAGEGYTCAVDSGGTISCWGDNSSSQIDLSAMPYVTNAATILVASGTNSDPGIEVSAASHHTCAVMKNSPTLVCWGTNTNGEVGPAASNPAGPTPPESGGFLGAAAGHDHSCAVSNTGQVNCWGENTSGQTGAPSTTTTTIEPTSLTGGAAISVTAGYAFTCAQDNAGDAYCWGSNQYGQLGSGTPPNTSPNPTPARVAMIGSVAQLSAGHDHACAIGGSPPSGGAPVAGPVFCWGNNASLQLGDGATDPLRTAPVGVAMP